MTEPAISSTPVGLSGESRPPPFGERKWLKGAALWVGMLTAIVLAICAAISIYRIEEQLRATVEWNRRNATFSFFSYESFSHIDHEFEGAMQKLPGGPIKVGLRKEKLTKEEVDAILEDPNARIAVKQYFTYLETFALGVRSNTLDGELAFHTRASALVASVDFFSPYIDRMQELQGLEVFSELEALAEDWKKKSEENRSRKQFSLPRVAQSKLD